METPATNGETRPDRPSRLYVVGVSHLDTQWRWTVRDVIERFLPRTLRENFALFEVFPDYVLSFEGSFRYQLAEEYYPAEFEKLQSWVREGRWRVAGSMVDAPDVNISAPESLIRHVLYGSRYFEERFGRSSVDIFLPDCFGFPFSLPTIAAHCGLIGFSSQKFNKWMAPSKIPFEIGLWEGPDGSRIIAALKPGGYAERLTEDLSRSRRWRKRLAASKKAIGVGLGMKYFGVGDRGGSPDEASLFWLTKSIVRTNEMEIIHSGSDQLFRDLDEETRDTLPVHRGELLLPTHGTGCWTSQAILKTWNRRNELLADAAERAASIASWLAQFPYPTDQLRADWIRFLWHQMHDDLTGTSIPEAYEITWNDQVLCLNRFATVLTDALTAIARGLDTDTEGLPLLLFNPLSERRCEAVEATIDFGSTPPAAVRVFDSDGCETPSQIVNRAAEKLTVVFLAAIDPLGVAVFDVRGDEQPSAPASDLVVGETFLENSRYRVELDARGDISRIFDKALERDLLSDSVKLELVQDRSRKWPAWEIQYDDLTSTPRPLNGKFEVEIVESGPVRGAVRILRRAAGSSIAQIIRLAAGEAGDCVEVVNEVRWLTRGHMLKARFPFACSNQTATYDLRCGVALREGNSPAKHEVPGHQWADLSDPEKTWGVSVLSAEKYGWDKPDERTLRLSLLRSPGILRRFPHQGTQDFGSHRFSYAVFGHCGDWRDGGTVARAERFNQPLRVFQAVRHPGALGRRLDLLSLDAKDVSVRALKRSEEGGEWILRLQETGGRTTRTTARLGSGIGSAREVDGRERERASAQVESGNLHTRLRPFQPRSFALRLTPAEDRIPPLHVQTLPLEVDTVATSFHSQKRGPDFDGSGHSIPGELLPAEIMSGEIPFRLHRAQPGEPVCLSCSGQQIALPAGGFDTVFLLATVATDLDRKVSIQLGDTVERLSINSWSRDLGQWRRQRFLFGRPWGPPEPGWVTKADVAWVGTHRHDRKLRNQAYRFCYLFRYALRLPVGCRSMRLPDDSTVKIFAAAVARVEPGRLVPAAELF